MQWPGSKNMGIVCDEKKRGGEKDRLVIFGA